MTDPAVPPPLRWWGWGDRPVGIPPGLAALLERELRVSPLPSPPAAPLIPRIPPSQLGDALRARLVDVLGNDGLDTSDRARLQHAAGRSYLDLLRLRSSDVSPVPDAVVSPSDVAQVRAVLRACADLRCAVVPFGGGTSVVGGVTPLSGGHHCVVTLSMRRLNRLLDLDGDSRTATLEAGMTGPEAEAALGGRGFTLGHFPQSFEYATVGGFAATRSAGQASSGYGRFNELVLGLRCVAPAGELVVAAHPASAAGPSLLELVLGSEGRLGVVTEVTVRVRRRPASHRYEAWSFRTFEAGARALRLMARRRVTPDIARLSDPEETRVGMAMAAHGGAVEAAGRRYLRARGHAGGCLLIIGWDSDAGMARARRRAARHAVRSAGGIALGAAPGNAWQRGRFSAPYLRDSLLDAGVMVETLETATSWSRLAGLRAAVTAVVRGELTDGGIPPLVGTHISHVYPSGASLYVTVLARPGEDPVGRWRRAKVAATDALLGAGGTLTHHHAVGVDHLPFMRREVGEEATAVLRSLAAELDPTGIMNPGKLIPD